MHPVERLTRHWKKRVRKEEAMSTNPQDGSQPTVVLVHGAWADGSGWQGVYNLLKDDYTVRIVQNPTLSLEGDVAATKMILDQQSEPVILVGHSYGGVVITEAGNDPKVAALVYIAGFVPDQGETEETLIGTFPSDVPNAGDLILPPQDGFLLLDREKFHESFAADLSADEGAFMADSQVPWGVEALTSTVSEAAWRSKPSWYLVSTEDRMIPRPPSARCLSGRVRPSRRPRAATRSTCRGRMSSLRSLKRPLPR
jgi:pimeloyl-ACP methyl ester carboxylesterase